jgi:predicted PurR-regulated permease PerM
MNSKPTFLPPLWILSLAVFFLVLLFVYLLKELFTLLVVAYCLAYLIHPAVTFLERKKISRSVGVIMVVFGIALLLASLVVIAYPTIAREFGQLADNFPMYFELAKQRAMELGLYLVKYLPQFYQEHDAPDYLDLLPTLGVDTFRRLGQAALAALLSGYSWAMALVNLLLLPFLFFYIAVDFRGIHERVLLILPVLKRDKVKAIGLEIDSRIRNFLGAQLIISTILFLLYAAGLWVIGVELWLLLAFITGFGNLIPYLGFIVGIVLTSIMALVTFGDFSHLLQVWGYFAVVQTLESIYITPKIQGTKVGISPLVVILAIVAGGKLFGILGVFLAVPLAAVLKILATNLRSWAIDRV